MIIKSLANLLPSKGNDEVRRPYGGGKHMPAVLPSLKQGLGARALQGGISHRQNIQTTKHMWK